MQEVFLNTISQKTQSDCTESSRRVYIVQPALPAYRFEFFSRLNQCLDNSLTVIHSENRDLRTISSRSSRFEWEHQIPAIKNVLGLFEWQPGVMNLDLGQCQCVVVSGNPRALSTIFLVLKARMKGVKTVWWGQYWSTTTNPISHISRLLISKFADELLFYTDAEISEYRSNILGKFDSRPLSALNNGLDLEKIARFRSVYKPSERTKSILFISRLTAKCQLDDLFVALSLLALDDVSIDVVGDGDEKASFQATAQALGLEFRVRWHGAITDEAEIARIANNCLLFVYPGSVGLSLIHAMSYGLPAIIHDDRWRQGPEFAAFSEGSTGLSFKMNDIDSLAAKIEALVREPRRLAEMSAESLKVVQDRFNLQGMVARMTATIQGTSTHD
jgi:glycosyltransferase involved in cell wall biosynthesis